MWKGAREGEGGNEGDEGEGRTARAARSRWSCSARREGNCRHAEVIERQQPPPKVAPPPRKLAPVKVSPKRAKQFPPSVKKGKLRVSDGGLTLDMCDLPDRTECLMGINGPVRPRGTTFCPQTSNSEFREKN
jgi:hypothetical protein